MSKDLYNLERFVSAQHAVYNQVLRELESGLKQSHWMWYIFPQIEGLGFSVTARRFALSCLEEARAYLNHPLLGVRLEQCTRLVNKHVDKTAVQIFGNIDALKFRSSMTLFNCVRPDGIFQQAILQFYSSEPDRKTLDLLKR